MWPRRIAMAAVLGCAVAGCAPRPETGFISPTLAVATNATGHELLVATTRERDGRPGTLFNGERGGRLDYAAIAMSVPAAHVSGNIEWPSRPPGNPETDFVVRQAAYLDDDRAFLGKLNAELGKHPAGERKVFLFVHGYNTMFAEGLYRFAQIVHDSRSTAVPVLFSWASRGKLAGYVYDTNSATAARDDLERTLRLIFASKADQVNILAHSMGNWVTVETFRQIKIAGGLPHREKLGYVVLAAPDVDVDVFKSQMRRIGKPRKPYYVVVSRDDKALRLSSFIAGEPNRLGSDANVGELAALGAIVIDLTDLKATDPSNHSKFAQIAAIAPQLRSVLANGIGADAGASSPGQQIAGTLGEVVALPLKLSGDPITIVARR